jgi:hypothetical protein
MRLDDATAANDELPPRFTGVLFGYKWMACQERGQELNGQARLDWVPGSPGLASGL